MLTVENYFSPEMNRHYVGSSQFKSFMACEHSALAELTGAYERPKGKALLMGSLFDSMFDGTYEKFLAENPEVFNSRTKELKADYQMVKEIYNRVSRDPYWMEMAAEGEQQVIMTGEIEGVPVKIMIDSKHPEVIVDRKLMKDFADVWVGRQKQPWHIAYGYDIQAAMYREIVRQNTGELLPFRIAAATKEKNSETGNLKTDLDVFQFTNSELDPALEYIRQNIVHIQEVKQGIIDPTRCDDCEYCRETKVLTGYRLFENIEI